jgi:hypothetical protein
VRAAIERIFSLRYRLSRMSYRGLAANVFHLDLAIIAHNLRTAAAMTG